MSLPLPHTTVVLAMSADGKIADHTRSAARFSSQADLHHLETQVAQADGVLSGAGTLRAYGTCLRVRQAALLQQRQARGQPPQPVQMVYSPRGELDQRWRFFQQAVPRWLITTATGALPWQQQGAFSEIFQMPGAPTPADWRSLLACWLDHGIQRLAILGGGYLVAQLVEADLVEELHLTVCPLLLGGQQAPTPMDGSGLPAAIAPRLRLLSAEARGDEVFLHYRRCRHPAD